MNVSQLFFQLKSLFFTLLFIGIGTGAFGQIDEYQYEESTEESPEDFPILHVKYFGLGINHALLRDELVAGSNYSGVGWNFSLLDCELWTKTARYNLLMIGGHITRVNPRFSEYTLNDPDFGYGLSYLEFDLFKLNAEFRINNSSHYLGGLFYLSVLFFEAPWSLNTDMQYRANTYDSILPLGISYLYDRRILGVPVNVNFSLPLVYHRVGKHGNRFGSLGSYFSPTAKVTLYASRQKDVPRRWEISYVWNYTNMTRIANLPYNHRRLTNGLNLTVGFYTNN